MVLHRFTSLSRNSPTLLLSSLCYCNITIVSNTASMFGPSLHVSTPCTHYRGFSVCFSDFSSLYKHSQTERTHSLTVYKTLHPLLQLFLCVYVYVRTFVQCCIRHYVIEIDPSDVLSNVCVVYSEVIQN